MWDKKGNDCHFSGMFLTNLTHLNAAPDRTVIHLPDDSRTDQVLCKKARLAYQTVYLQNEILSLQSQCVVFYRLTINWGLLALETDKA